jgi:Cu(I)/Ag(I) efflux system membrane protein CusA/SilA
VRLTLADVADISLVPGPPMLRSENGQLATYIHVNTTRSDVSALVAKLQQSIADGVDLPVGYTLDWSGQFEYLQHAMERLRVLVPATLVLIFLLIYLIFRNVGDVLVIMLSLPLALIGGLWLIWLMGHAVSVASVIGFIALAGVAAEFGVIMMLTLRQAWQHELKQNPRAGRAELDRAIREGALMRVRPKAMTVAVIMAGLLPILVGTGAGSEVMQRIAAPMVGGMLTAPLLSMLVIPAAFRLLRQREIAGKRA